MVRLTFDNVAVKLGKAVDPRTLSNISLPGTQIDDLGSFEKFTVLEEVDLANNRICFQRQLGGLFGAKSTLKHVNLAGNPVCSSVNYRFFVIYNLPELVSLDGVLITPGERHKAERVIGRGETLEDESAPHVDEEEVAQLASSSKKAVPSVSKEELRRQQQLEFEKEKAEAERIAAMLASYSFTSSSPAKDEPVTESQTVESKKCVEEAPNATKQEASKPSQQPRNAQPREVPAESKIAVEIKPKDVESRPYVESKPKVVEPAPANVEAKTKVSAAKPAELTSKPQQNSTKAETIKSNSTSTSNDKPKAGLVFEDGRSGLKISTALSDGVAMQPVKEVPKVEPRKPKFSEESLFGTASHSEEIDFSALNAPKGRTNIDDLLGPSDDLLNKATKSVDAKVAKRTAASKSSLFDDEDDLVNMLGKPSAKSKNSAAADDLFAMLGPPANASAPTVKSQSNVESADFDIDSYISSSKSSGGLFD